MSQQRAELARKLGGAALAFLAGVLLIVLDDWGYIAFSLIGLGWGVTHLLDIDVLEVWEWVRPRPEVKQEGEGEDGQGG